MSMRLAALALVPFIAAFAACSSSEGPVPVASDGGSPPTDAGVDASPEPLAWEPCSLKSEGGGPPAECTTAQVPLRAGVNDGKTIDMRVKRYRPAGGKGLRQLWMLQGGPGGSAYVFEGLAEIIGARFPDVDYYLPDHRGTGKSSRIGCAAEGAKTEGGFFITASEWPACIAEAKATWGEGLAAFSTTNAANDLGLLVERAKVPGQPVFVYGVSYGTYWANRYMQLFPEQAEGVILDSVAPPGASLARQDEDANEAAKDFFALCAKDPVCGQKLGADPWAKANALFAKLKAGHCPDIGVSAEKTHVLLRRAFGQMLMNPEHRLMIPPIVYRADRCEPRDVTALKPLVASLIGEGKPNEMLRQWGFVLSNNVLFSELWETPSPTAAVLAGIREASVASRDVTSAMDPLIGIWPTYPADPYMGKWATREKPVLVLQGGLDPATLVRKAREAKAAFARPGQRYVEVASATHTVIASSPALVANAAGTVERRSCGTIILMSFLENPTAPDTSCLDKLVPFDFAAPATLVQDFFGIADAWE